LKNKYLYGKLGLYLFYIMWESERSGELLTRHVVHGKVVHVGLHELQSLILDHFHGLGVKLLLKLR